MLFILITNLLLNRLIAFKLSGTGEASFYLNPTQQSGKCNYTHDEYPKYASVGIPVFSDSKSCGMCIKVTNTDTYQSTIVHVVDQCVGCGVSDLDLSLVAFEDIGEVADGRVDIEWHFVECPDDDDDDDADTNAETPVYE